MIETASLVEYWDRGFLAMPGEFGAEEVAAWQTESSRLARQGRPGAALDRVVEASASFAALARDPRILDLVGHLFGHAAVLMEASLLTSRLRRATRPFLRHHSSRSGFGVPPDQMLTVAVGIAPANPDAVAVEMLPEQHRPTPAPLDIPVRKGHLSGVHVQPLAPGDLLCIHSLTPHRFRPAPLAEAPATLRLSYVVDSAGGIYDRVRAWRG
ncbi:MAG: hypothetical protein SFU57_06590 [Gemmatimonadales bacterium]|nr:hypothetical protein [Gemmatimonadales bacterium]